MGKLLVVGEVAGQCRTTSHHIYKLIRNGELKAVRVGKAIRVVEEDLQAYLNREATQ